MVLFSAKLTLIQIVLLVTKAVGDFLGTNGIAEETIKFNGFPFLEKEDHAYNVTGTSNFTRLFCEGMLTPQPSIEGNANRSLYNTGHWDVRQRYRYADT